MALENDPQIALAESRLDPARGSLLLARSDFDTRLQASLDASEISDPIDENTSQAIRSVTGSASAARLLRSGQTLQPTLQLTQDDGAGQSTGTIDFTVRQPLLRGRRPAAVTALERAAEREIEAARLDRLHRVAARLLFDRLERAIGLFHTTLEDEEKKLRAGRFIFLDELKQRECVDPEALTRAPLIAAED